MKLKTTVTKKKNNNKMGKKAERSIFILKYKRIKSTGK